MKDLVGSLGLDIPQDGIVDLIENEEEKKDEEKKDGAPAAEDKKPDGGAADGDKDMKDDGDKK